MDSYNIKFQLLHKYFDTETGVKCQEVQTVSLGNLLWAWQSHIKSLGQYEVISIKCDGEKVIVTSDGEKVKIECGEISKPFSHVPQNAMPVDGVFAERVNI